jgi:hypothetical protein
MDAIRPLERQDLPQVASLVELRLGSGSSTPSPGLEQLLERTLLDQPWADPEIPSLVYVEKGSARLIRGFIASQVRRMRFDGQLIRVACASHFVVDPQMRVPAGALLMSRMLHGSQELTISDTGGETTSEMWERLGGERVYAGCLRWFRILRPWSYLAHVRLHLRPRLAWGAGRALRACFSRLDGSSRWAWPDPFRPKPPTSSAELLSPATLLEQLPSVTANLRLAPAYDQPYLDWLFDELARKNRGEAVGAIVKVGGRARGWFLYYFRPGGIGLVVTIAARAADDAAIVVDHLFHDAYERGVATLLGRPEPQLLPVLATRRCQLRPGSGQLIYSRTPEIMHAIQSGDSLLTELEGEWVGLPSVSVPTNDSD